MSKKVKLPDNVEWTGGGFKRKEKEMANIDLKKLRSIAETATPGPWFKEGNEILHDYDEYATQTGIVDCTVTICEFNRLEKELPDAKFIATFNPQLVLSLLDKLEELEKVKTQWDKYQFAPWAGVFQDYHDVVDDLNKRLAKAKEALERIVKYGSQMHSLSQMKRMELMASEKARAALKELFGADDPKGDK